MFWLHEEDLPAGVGNERFCAMHLVYIAFFLAATILYGIAYKKLGTRRPGRKSAGAETSSALCPARVRADRIAGSLAFFFGLCEYGITALVGRFSLYTLPIHVCSLMYLFVPLHAWTDRAKAGSAAAKLHEFLGAVIFHPGILAAWAALLFPDWLYYPFWNYLSICGFMGHGMVSVYCAGIIVQKSEAQEQKKLFLLDFARSAAFLLSGMAIMYFFDQATGTNYWFMAGPGVGSPLTGPWLRGGYKGYLTAFIAAGTAVTALWYGLRWLLFVRRKSK